LRIVTVGDELFYTSIECTFLEDKLGWHLAYEDDDDYSLY